MFSCLCLNLANLSVAHMIDEITSRNKPIGHAPNIVVYTAKETIDSSTNTTIRLAK